MLLKELREQVLEANLELVRRGLVLYTFGNASGVVMVSHGVLVTGADMAEAMFRAITFERMCQLTVEQLQEFADRIHFLHLRSTKREDDPESFFEADHLAGEE